MDVAAWVEGDEVHVTVRDNGVGIAEADQARIFEAFQRGDRRTSAEGTGLGLTLSKRFVELHGGRMWLSSALGEGSMFGFVDPGAPGLEVVLVVGDDRCHGGAARAATAPARAPDHRRARRRRGARAGADRCTRGR